jgi:dihydrofolate reductase
MKVILWAALSANGNYSRATPDNPPRPQALQDFEKHAKATGNLVVGRATFEGFAARGPNPAFASMDIVVVSHQPLTIPGVLLAPCPRAALELLKQRGHRTALLSGGEKLHNAFLADELVLNYLPVIEGEGLSIHLPAGRHKAVKLQGTSDLGDGVTQMRYSFSR